MSWCGVPCAVSYLATQWPRASISASRTTRKPTLRPETVIRSISIQAAGVSGIIHSFRGMRPEDVKRCRPWESRKPVSGHQIIIARPREIVRLYPKRKMQGQGLPQTLSNCWREITNHPEDVRPVFRNFFSSASLRLCVPASLRPCVPASLREIPFRYLVPYRLNPAQKAQDFR